jgi:hypothetical protein
MRLIMFGVVESAGEFGHGLFQGTIPAFNISDNRKPRNSR